MILTRYVMYKGKQKKVEELSHTSGYKVQVQCPECGEVRDVYYRSICKAGHTICHKCINKIKLSKELETNSIYGRLTVIGKSDKSGYSICKCECGDITEISNWNLISGKTQSCGCLRSENIKKVSVHPTNEKHWNWKGGIAGERNSDMSKKTYKDWRIAVFERDSYKCNKCKQTGRKLRAHHICNYADNKELRLDIENGITLCEKCHRAFHKLYGNKTNKNQLEEFLKLKRW